MAEKKIKVLVRGVLGRVGQEVSNAVQRDPGFEFIGGVDIKADRNLLQSSDGLETLPLYTHLEQFLLNEFKPDVLVDFTQHDAVMAVVRLATERGINLVVGTTGISEAELTEIDQLAKQCGVGAVVAPNFSLGAVLMMYLSKVAARFSEFSYAEIIELHHEQKADSPSGTAIATAKAMVEARGEDFVRVESKKESLPGARGAQHGGISIHSVRLQGLMAHQEVILGTLGQTLRIRHDQISREGFCPGVILAIKAVTGLRGLTFGLDKLMGL